VATLVNFLKGGMSPSAVTVLQDSHRCNGKPEHDVQVGLFSFFYRSTSAGNQFVFMLSTSFCLVKFK
jgi:hypothetical protein